MPLPLCVLPGILGTEERVAPGEGAENRRDGRMISAPTNHREPAPGGRTLCAPTEGRGTRTVGGLLPSCGHPSARPEPFVGAAISRPWAHTVLPYGRTENRDGGGLSCHPAAVCLPGPSRFVGAAISRPRAHAVRPYGRTGNRDRGRIVVPSCGRPSARPEPFCRGGYQPPAGARCAPLRKGGEPGRGRIVAPSCGRPSARPEPFVGAAISRPWAHAVRPYEKRGSEPAGGISARMKNRRGCVPRGVHPIGGRRCGVPMEAQRSGFHWERTSSERNEPCPTGQGERSGACEDEIGRFRERGFQRGEGNRNPSPL